MLSVKACFALIFTKKILFVNDFGKLYRNLSERGIFAVRNSVRRVTLLLFCVRKNFKEA